VPTAPPLAHLVAGIFFVAILTGTVAANVGIFLAQLGLKQQVGPLVAGQHGPEFGHGDVLQYSVRRR
jgi:hypothetical protein